jgi:hypothetical protein
MKTMSKILMVAMLGLGLGVSLGEAQSDLLTNTNYANWGYGTIVRPFTAPEYVSLDVTNGATIYLIHPRIVLHSHGGADLTTNAVTIARPYYIPGSVLIRLDLTSTNSVSFADNGNVLSLGGTVGLHTNGCLLLEVTATNCAAMVSSSAN